MRLTLGSTSAHKLDALRQACSILGHDAVVINGTKTSSGQNEQPVGFDETHNGAWRRAILAQKTDEGSIGVGIESGIFRFGKDKSLTLDIAVVVVLTVEGRRIITTSQGVEFPEEYVRIAEERGFAYTTVGSVITEKLGGDPTDPHSTLTNGKVTRSATLVDALVVALRQI